MGYSKDILAKNLTPFGFHQEIHTAIAGRYFPTKDYSPSNFRRQLQTMSKGERAFILTWVFFNDINDGGFDMFFSEEGADLAHETAEAYELMGFHQTSAFIRKAMLVAGIPNPFPRDFDYSECDSEERYKALRLLTKEYRNASEPQFEEIVVEYVRQHPDQFT